MNNLVDIIKFIKNNPKKSIVIFLSLLCFAIGNLLIQGCAYKLHVDKADNLTHSIDIKR